MAAPIVVLAALALLGIAVANVQVARERDGVARDLATARVAAARVADHLTTDVDALEADLDLLMRSGNRARAGSTGPGWAVADRADLGRGQVRTLRRDITRIGPLVDAAAPLREALSPLLGPGTEGASMTGPEGPSGLNALDDLARGLSRYATAAERAADPNAAALARAALAAGMLPALAGGEGPRSWTVCREAAGPCFRVKVTEARSGTPVPSPARGTASPPGRRWAAGVDVLVIGVEPDTLFRPGGRFDPAAAFALLLQLDRGRGAEPAVTMRSAVGPEQQAIDQLGRN
jgi:hypothetical protein